MADTLKRYREAFPEFRDMKDAELIDSLWTRYGGENAGIAKEDFALQLQGRGPRIGAFEAAKEGLKSSLQTGAAKVLSDLGADETAAKMERSATARREDVEARYQPRIRGYEDIESIADVPEYAGQLIAGSAPQTGLGIVGAGIGALASAKIPALRGVMSKTTGASIGAGTAGFPAYFGSNIERQMEEGTPFEETSSLAAGTAAAGQSAFDVLAFRTLFKGVPGLAELTPKAQASWVGRAATRAVEAGAAEVLTETGQQALELMQANPEKFFEFGPGVQKELINAAIGGGIVGGLLGGAAGAVSRAPRPMVQTEPEAQTESDQQQEPEKKPDLLALPAPEGGEPTGGPEGGEPPAPGPEGEPLAPAPRQPEPDTTPAPEPVAGPEGEPTAPIEPVEPVEPAAPVAPAKPKAPDLFTMPVPPELPKPLKLGKWTYTYGNKGKFELAFATDVEKALFQASKKTLKDKDPEYVQWLKDQGLSDNEIKGYGAQFRQLLKEQVEAQLKAGKNSGTIAVPRFTLKGLARPEPGAPAPKPAPVTPPAPAPVMPPKAAPTPAPQAPIAPVKVPFTESVSVRKDRTAGNNSFLVTKAPDQEQVQIQSTPRELQALENALPGAIDLLREVHARLLPGTDMRLVIENDPDSTRFGWNAVGLGRSFTLSLNPNAIAKAARDEKDKKAFLTQTMFHELSHNVENFYLSRAPKNVLNAIVDQYMKERNPNAMIRAAIYESIRKLRPSEKDTFLVDLRSRLKLSEAEYRQYLNSSTKVLPEFMRAATYPVSQSEIRDDYYRSFTEWVAEKGAEWLTKEAEGIVPKTVFQTFQKNILNQLRKLYNEIVSALGIKPTEGAFEKFMRDNYGTNKTVGFNAGFVRQRGIIKYTEKGATQGGGKASSEVAVEEAPSQEIISTGSAAKASADVQAAQQKLAKAYTAPPKMGFKGFLNLVKEAYESGSYKNLGDAITRQATDRFIDLRRLDERYVAWLKSQGRKLQAAYDDRYSLAANLSSYASILARENVLGMLETVLKYGGAPTIKKFGGGELDGVLTIDRSGNQKGLSFLGDLVRKDKLDAFKYYAMAKRVLGRYSDKKAPITQAEARSIVALYEKDADVVSAYKQYQDFNKSLMQMAVDSGVISQNVADEFTKHNDYYPFYREMDETGKYTGPLFTSGVLTRTKIQQAIGGTEALEADPIEVIMKNAQFWMHSASKNLASRKIYTMMTDLGEARPLNGKQGGLRPGEIEGVTRVNGLEQRFAIANPDIAAALETTGAHQLPNWTGVPGKVTQIYRELVTRSPDFIFKNIIRDPLNAFVTSGVSFNPFAAMDNFRKALVDPTNKNLMAIQNYGVVGGFRTIPGIEDATQLLNTSFTPSANGIYVVPNGNVLNQILSKAWNRLGAMSEASDAATRMEIYKRVLEATGNEAEAAFRAQEVINFRKQGASSLVRYLSILVPFVNGRLQGMDVTARAFSTGNLANTMMKGGYLFAVSMALQALMGDDEEYKQLPDYVRYGSLAVPLKFLGFDGGFLAIPKPFEIGFVFQTFPEILVQAAMGNTEQREIKRAAWEQLKSTFGLALFPQIVSPIFEILLNRSNLTGLPIVTDAMKNLPAELQYTSATSDIVKNLAGAAGLSPVQVEALIKGYGGQIVTSVLGLVDGMYRSATGTGVDKDWTQYPTVSTFLKTQQNTNPKGVSDVYRLSAEIQGLTTAINTYVAQGQANKAVELMKENEDLFTVKSSVAALRTQLNTLSRNERMIVNNPKISQEQKEAQLEQIRAARRQIGKVMTENLVGRTGK